MSAHRGADYSSGRIMSFFDATSRLERGAGRRFQADALGILPIHSML
jgi:hypothetical protein